MWITTALIGISFSLVPAVLWPAVSILVEAPGAWEPRLAS